jgi:transcriptional regulator with XRE-family HTH domain
MQMDTYITVKNRLLQLLGEKNMSIHKLAMESAVAPSSIKNILYGKSRNPGIVTLKMLCDGFGISLAEFFDTKEFKNLEQEIK